LLDALQLGRSEQPQSLYLAWLLGPNGPLTDSWLLRRILQMALPSMRWPGNPRSVHPEVTAGGERPDIVAQWDRFCLIIEYKVDSPEGDQQIPRYLDRFRIHSTGEGLLVYVTPSGRWPTSIQDDERVLPMSYGQLINCIDQGLEQGDEPTERGRALAREYQDWLKRTLNRSTAVGRPTISAATKLLTEKHEHLDRLKAAACEEASEFVEYMVSQAEASLRQVLGPDMLTSDWPGWGIYVFRKPQWQNRTYEYGISYGADRNLGDFQMHEFRHYLSVRVQPLSRKHGDRNQKAFAEAIRQVIRPHLKEHDDGWNSWHAFWTDIPFKAQDNWDAWANGVVEKLAQLGRAVMPALDRFASQPGRRR
jgi:hypothetical protein